jgi:hypothetical protein
MTPDSAPPGTDGLRAQQLAFAAWLQADGQPAAATALLQATGSGGHARIDVYAQAYPNRLTAALRDNFSVLAQALGDDGFDVLARAYIHAHPSAQPSIRWFGHQLADFMALCLARQDGLVPHPALADLARMDWALRAAFDAADAPLLSAGTLAAVAPADWPALRLQLHPSAQLQRLDWAVEAAWRVLRETLDAAEAAAAARPGASQATTNDDPALPAPQALPHTLLVWRQGLATRWRSLAPLEALLLQAVADGASFAQLCSQAAALLDDTGTEADAALPAVVAALQQWLADGLLRG